MCKYSYVNALNTHINCISGRIKWTKYMYLYVLNKCIACIECIEILDIYIKYIYWILNINIQYLDI